MLEKNLESIDNLALKRRLAKISPVESRIGISYCVTPSNDYVLLKDDLPADDLENPREAVQKAIEKTIKQEMKSNDFIITFGIGVGYLYCKLKKLVFLKYFDLVMPSIAIAQGFGRVGCMFAGCCYGRETDSWFHVIYHSYDFAPNGVALIPTQMVMAILNFAHFFILVFLIKKLVKHDGQIAGFYLVFYSIGRFFLEYLRNDPRGSVDILSTSQFISLFILAAGVGTILLCGYLGKKQAAAVDNGLTEEVKVIEEDKTEKEAE